MSQSRIRVLRAEIEDARQGIFDINAVARAAKRELSDVESNIVDDCQRKISAAQRQIDQFASDVAIRKQITELSGGREREYKVGEDDLQNTSGRSLGAQFLASATGRELLERAGHIPKGVFSTVGSELEFSATTLTEDAASGGDLVVPDYRPGIIALRQRRIHVAALFASGVTNSNAVTSMKEVTFTNAAAPTAEGAAKPESALAFDAVTDGVVKIPHWLPITEEVLEDVPALRSYVDARLRLGVNLAFDNQLLNGNGTPPNMTGVLNRSGLATAVARGADTNADAILKQIAAIASDKDVVPDGIVVHPTNWLTIQLSKNGAGDYYASGGPFAAPRVPMLWGLPVAVTSAIAANTALVGAFGEAGQVFIRSGIRVEVSNSHNDYFVKNLLAIRAEMRAALSIYRPDCFGTVTGLN